MLENVRGLLDPKFDTFRKMYPTDLEDMDTARNGDCSKQAITGLVNYVLASSV